METTQEVQALSTEMSIEPPPIPNIPPVPNPLPSTTSPTPPSLSQTPNNTIASRKILKPALPTKRPLPERPPHNDKNSPDVANAFLPRELAEVVATRQRRERAWHARLMICTTFHSNIESTLSNFSNEIEKEEAAAFKAYIQLAIAKFAAVDFSPPPPKIPTHSRPAKGDGIDNSKEKSGVKKVAAVIPKNITPQTKEKSWATVARVGQKKARVIQSKQPQVPSTGRQTHRPASTDKPNSSSSPSTNTPDSRLFFRLPQEHEWRRLSPAGIREIVVKKLHISPSLIGRIKPVRSGFALSPSNPEARKKILEAENGLFLSGAKLEAATNWVSVMVPTVPATVHMEQGIVEVSKSLLSDEIERVCSMRPAHLKLYGGNKPDAPHKTWLAYFPKAPRSGFRVFDESGIARSYKKKQPLEFCKRCNGHHPAKNCSRAPSCANCGSTNHSADICMAATKCRNCGGPHRADSRRCLARPTRSGAPTKEQMKTFRLAGEREYQAVHRARVAEEKAATTDRIDIDIISSQVSEDMFTPENTQAAPVEDSMGVASRL